MQLALTLAYEKGKLIIKNIISTIYKQLVIIIIIKRILFRVLQI